MALKNCPDCDREVSSSAPACTNCGRPIGSNALLGSLRTCLALLAAIAVAVASWGTEHVSHDDTAWEILRSPEHTFSLMGVIGGVLFAWLLTGSRPGQPSGGT